MVVKVRGKKYQRGEIHCIFKLFPTGGNYIFRRGHSVASYVQKDTPANSFLPDDVTYAAFVR